MKIFLCLLSTLFFIANINAYQNYYTFFASIDMKLNQDGDGVVPDLPFKIYGFVAVHNNIYIHDRLEDTSLDGETVVAKITVKQSDKTNAENLSGFICITEETLKQDDYYLNNYTIKIKDVERYYDEELKQVVECNGADKDDPYVFSKL